jgi:hypothetical protein
MPPPSLRLLGVVCTGLLGAARSADPRGTGNALFCDESSDTCWRNASASPAVLQSAPPFLVLQESAAAAAFKAGAPADVAVTLVPSLAPLWERRPRAAAPAPADSLWDVACDALLGCTDELLMRPQPLPDIGRGAPSGLSVVLWVQGRAIHGGDVYATLLNHSKPHVGIQATVDSASAHVEWLFLASLAGRPYNVSLSTAGCARASLFDGKPHQVAFMLDGAARLASLMVDDALCSATATAAADVDGWASWAEGASAASIKHFYAAYQERGLTRLTIYTRTLLTSEVLGSYYSGPP